MKRKITFGNIEVTGKSKNLIREALESERLSCGQYVRKFEEAFARLIRTKEAVAVSSGTDADALALAVLYDFGAKRQDEVILPALSFVSTGNAVLQAGFTPVFVDIDRKTLNIDPGKIESAISKKTRAIMPVHLMGKPAAMDAINAIAKKNELYVIEDAAEAHGTLYQGRPAGALADMGAFSLYVAHMISTGEGGMVTADNPDFAAVLRSLRSHGRACNCASCVLNVHSGYCPKRFQGRDNRDRRFIFERIGFSSKMNELEAAVGLGNLEAYPGILKKRRGNLLYMLDKFREFLPYLYTISEDKGEQIGPHALPIILKEKVRFNRDKLVFFLERRGIDSRSLFLSMPTQCPGFKYLGYKLGDFPDAEYIGDNGLHIGIHQGLSRADLDYILDAIREFLKKNA
jgi:dTDP-4-amino-4,6-dideoxygalactose transaminase